MSDFKAKMHQNRFGLGLCPRPRWRNLQRSPRPPSWIKRGLLLREGDVGREGKGRKGRGDREGKGRERRGRDEKGGHPPNILLTPSSSFLEICLLQIPCLQNRNTIQDKETSWMDSVPAAGSRTSVK